MKNPCNDCPLKKAYDAEWAKNARENLDRLKKVGNGSKADPKRGENQ